MYYDEAEKKIKDLITKHNIVITDETKPTELFEAFTKLLASVIAEQPTHEDTSRKIARDVFSSLAAKGRL